MYYEKELQFLCNALNKLRIQTTLINPDSPMKEYAHISLTTLLMTDNDKSFSDFFGHIQDNTIYNLTTKFDLHFFILKLPHTDEKSVLISGPYITSVITDEEIISLAEKNKISTDTFNSIKKYYGNVPVFYDQAYLFILLEVFGEALWGNGKNYNFIDIDNDFSNIDIPFKSSAENEEDVNPLIDINAMARRYDFENELMDMVSQGQSHKAQLLFSTFTPTSLENRSNDPLRNFKNYCIITNTLLRKAAEKGGVHPVHLDKLSSGYGFRIEQALTLNEAKNLLLEMVEAYCNLVKKHSVKNFSYHVQNALMCIDANLSATLNLSTLAKLQNISPPYLSGLFKKETGKTITAYITEKRINLAKKLLTSTQLQVQTIAQKCGFVDMNYFSKTFKKMVGKTPVDYRIISKNKSDK